MTLDDLGDRIFATVPEVSEIFGYDRDGRTVRKAIAAGEIPAIRHGATYRIPAAWLREHVGDARATPEVPAPAPDPDALADAVADRVIARLARALLATMNSVPGGENAA